MSVNGKEMQEARNNFGLWKKDGMARGMREEQGDRRSMREGKIAAEMWWERGRNDGSRGREGVVGGLEARG